MKQEKYELQRAFFEAAIGKSNSMREAANNLGLHFNTFTRYAKKLGLYKTNQSGKGGAKDNSARKFLLADILAGKHPQYSAHALRLRLISEGIKEHKCEMCGTTEWLNKPVPLECHHIDGNTYNHLLINLQLLCPNCHSFTPNYRGRNVKNNPKSNAL